MGEKRMAVIRLDKLEQKREIMRERRKVKERGIKIEDDLTWRERKMKWRLERIAGHERGKGKRVWLGYGKIQIEGRWWKWEEEEEVLRDNEGNIWREQGEGQGSMERVIG